MWIPLESFDKQNERWDENRADDITREKIESMIELTEKTKYRPTERHVYAMYTEHSVE